MRIHRYLEQLDNHAWIARLLQIVALAMAIVILVLSRRNTIVHVVPPKVEREYWINATQSSREYIEQMAVFFTTNLLTVNPDNAAFVTKAFVDHLTPEARARLETALLGEAAYIKSRGLTQAFYPRSIDFHSAKRLSITGTLVQWIAGKTITQRNATYDLTVETSNYGITVADFERVQDDARHHAVDGAASSE